MAYFPITIRPLLRYYISFDILYSDVLSNQAIFLDLDAENCDNNSQPQGQ